MPTSIFPGVPETETEIGAFVTWMVLDVPEAETLVPPDPPDPPETPSPPDPPETPLSVTVTDMV